MVCENCLRTEYQLIHHELAGNLTNSLKDVMDNVTHYLLTIENLNFPAPTDFDCTDDTIELLWEESLCVAFDKNGVSFIYNNG